MRVRKLGVGALAWRGGSLEGGQVGDVPVDVLERYAHKLQVLEPIPQPEPEAVVTEVLISTSTGEETRLTSVKSKAKPRARKRKSR